MWFPSRETPEGFGASPGQRLGVWIHPSLQRVPSASSGINTHPLVPARWRQPHPEARDEGDVRESTGKMKREGEGVKGSQGRRSEMDGEEAGAGRGGPALEK